MRRLRAIDAQFLYLEEEIPAAHQHTIKVSTIGPNEAADYSFADSKVLLGERLHRLPPFRWRVVRVPGDLHEPLFVEDPDFDLDFHVRRMAVPAPGGIHELCELISDIASRPLDRNRPLWELYLIEGLEDGGLASVAKVHHTLADGVASAELLDLFYDATADAQPSGRDDWQPEAIPGRWSLLAHAVPDLARLLVDGLPRILGDTRRARRLKKATPPLVSEPPPKSFTAPRTPLNRPLTPHRSFTVISVPLDDIRKVKTAFGTTINDVVLATAAGGVRRYLLERDALPATPMVASVPVSTRPPEARLTWGNHLAKIYVSLRTDVADPIERLQASRRAANAAKADLEATRGSRLEDWIEYLPVFLLRLLVRVLNRRFRSGKAPSENLVVSNVPGPRSKLYIGGSPVTSFFSVGPLVESVGLNITAWSYVDQMNVCLLSCREAVPDLWHLTDLLRESFDELAKLAADRSTTSSTTQGATA